MKIIFQNEKLISETYKNRIIKHFEHMEFIAIKHLRAINKLNVLVEIVDTMTPLGTCSSGRTKQFNDEWTHWITFRADCIHTYPEEYFDDVIGHEFAHVIVDDIWGRAHVNAHGPEFNRVCDVLDIPKGARSSFHFSMPTKRERFEWTCSCHSHFVGARKHNKNFKILNSNSTIQRGMRCIDCKNVLTFVKEHNFK